MSRRFIGVALLFTLSLTGAQAQTQKVWLNGRPFRGIVTGRADDCAVQANSAFEMLGLNVTVPETAVTMKVGSQQIDILWMKDVAMVKVRDLARLLHGHCSYSSKRGTLDVRALVTPATPRVSFPATDG